MAPETLDVTSLIHKLVDVARVLTGARYGALRLIDEGGEESDFIFTGFGEDQLAAERQQFFFSSEEPQSENKKPGVISVPIRRSERLFGTIYLASKADGGTFDTRDSELLELLAAIAEAAVERASLGAEHLRRKRMVEGITALTRAVIEDPDEEAIQDITCEQAREIHDADMAIAALARSVQGEFRVVRCERELGLFVESESMAHVTPRVESGGHSYFSPIVADGRGIGSITIINQPGSRELDHFDREILQTFADRAALTIEFTRLRKELSRIAVYEERERIARDLHDTVIQELFAAGIGVEAIIPTVGSEAAKKLHETVDALDTAIADLRGLIFRLETDPRDGVGLRGVVNSVATEQANVLGFTPKVSLSGPIDSVRSDVIRADIAAVTREALSNVARHANATEAAVYLDVTGSEIILRVEDNGSGSDEYVRADGHGTENFHDRARSHGGSATIGSADGCGTVVEWRIPWKLT
ncbi:MAG: hypothetical protein DCC49_07495 [Acidobacteria bacterium]|nr:MAG: hypothetical protein DCC49_07495 [Acidobacteriota bacterium]